MHKHRRFRLSVCFLAVLAAAGCFRRTKAPEPVSPVIVADTTGRDTVRVDSARADSAALADSIRAAQHIADSLLADSIRVLAQDTARGTRVTTRRATSRSCVLDWSESPPESRATLYRYAHDTSSNTFIGGGFVGHCQGQNNTIRADSAEFFQTAGVLNLYGNVQYTEPTKLQFHAQRANYFTRDERLYAEGNVVATQLESGSTFSGSTMEYYRVTATRPVSRLYAPGRPTVLLTEQSKDASRTPPPPVEIRANVMEDRGDSVLYAWGAVTIDRGEIRATSDSASYDKFGSEARLIRGAKVASIDPQRPFTLIGDTIRLFNRERTLERVVALHNANAVNGDLELRSETIDLRLLEQQLERAFAFGEGRAFAKTPQQDLEADSLAIFMLGRRVRDVHAIGKARALGVPDTTKIRSADRDMLIGDSVFASFDTVGVPGDTGSDARIREIRSIGNASSLFQIASNRGPAFPPSLNYARGRTIRITFDSAGVTTVQVDSAASGVFLEPIPDSIVVDTTRGRPPASSPPPQRPEIAGNAAAYRPSLPETPNRNDRRVDRKALSPASRIVTRTGRK